MAGATATPISSRLEDLEGFLRELSALDEKSAPRATFLHFAAKVSVPWCESHPEETRATNVDSTVAATRVFIEECRRRGVEPSILSISSAHLYARNDSPIRETDPVSPRSVYARSKLEAERSLLGLASELGFSVRITRVFGLVAPIQPDHYVLHALLRRAREGDVKGIPGLENERDYLDSRDVCRALVGVAELDESEFVRVCPDRVLNVGSGRAISIRSLAEKCVRAIRPAEEAERLVREMSAAPARADDVPRIVASIDRYRGLFGEGPARISIDETIRDSIAERPSGRMR
jgi:UDP-glucose 4-epimerase